MCAAGWRCDGGRRLQSGEERGAGRGGEGGAAQEEQHGMVVRVDLGVSSYFGLIVGANWALGRARGEVV